MHIDMDTIQSVFYQVANETKPVPFFIDILTKEECEIPQELFHILSTDDPVKNGMVDLSTLEQLYNKGMLEVSNC